MTTSDLPVTDKTRLRRAHQRGSHDRETINAILDAGLLCHVGYVVDGQPFVTPTCHWREGDRLYWHGSAASRMIRAAASGVPVCVTVSHLDGLVMARSGFHHSVNYRSVMLFGAGQAITDETETLASLERLVDRITPGRWAELRPVNDKELKATTVVSMPIDEASAKIRGGPPVDDEEDYDLDVWAGVVPVRTVVGPPVDDPRLKPGIAAPAYLADIKI